MIGEGGKCLGVSMRGVCVLAIGSDRSIRARKGGVWVANSRVQVWYIRDGHIEGIVESEKKSKISWFIVYYILLL